MILHFRPIQHLQGPGELLVDERECVEHPRLTHLQQCMPVDGELLKTNNFVVRGKDGEEVFGTLLKALAHLRANPMPDDVVAIPPLESSEPDP